MTFDPKELRRLAKADARKLGNDDWTPAQWAKAEMQYLSCLRKHRDAILALIECHAAARDAAIEEAAKLFDEKAAVHARQATWIGPERQKYDGPRIAGIEMSPMNGPAIAHDAELANAARIRALKSGAKR